MADNLDTRRVSNPLHETLKHLNRLASKKIWGEI